MIAFLRGHLGSVASWRACLTDATVTSARIFIVIFGALVFAQFINLSGLPCIAALVVGLLLVLRLVPGIATVVPELMR